MNPGAGAIEYAASLVIGLTREQAALILQNHMPEDKRVKRCSYCGYLWRDESLRNTARTCCGECKTAIKTEQKARQRADKALLTGKTPKKTKREINYIWWLEYPFWISEYEATKQAWKYERPYDPHKLAYMEAAVIRKQNHGRKRHSTKHYWD